MARFQNLHFWNPCAICDCLASTKKMGVFFQFRTPSRPMCSQCILHYTYLLEYKLTLQNTILYPQCSFLVGAVDTFWQAPPSAFQAMLAFVKNKMLSMRWSFPTRRQTALSHRHVTNSSFNGILHVPIFLISLGH